MALGGSINRKDGKKNSNEEEAEEESAKKTLHM